VGGVGVFTKNVAKSQILHFNCLLELNIAQNAVRVIDASPLGKLANE
jgi:hypothetical protein